MLVSLDDLVHLEDQVLVETMAIVEHPETQVPVALVVWMAHRVNQDLL